MLFWRKKKAKEEMKAFGVEEMLQKLVRNGIAVEQNGAKAPAERGSRIGGRPYVPKDFAWPTYTGENYDGEVCERPLSFLCQIDLSEVTVYDTEKQLPERGMLYFFYDCETMRWGFDPADGGCARVFFFGDVKDGDFAEAAFPETLGDEYRFAPIALSFSRQSSCPSWDEAELHASFTCDWETYGETAERLGFEEICERHKLLGYADLVQGEMLTECERVSRGLYCGDPESYQSTPGEVEREIRREAVEWTLLFQLSTVEEDGCEMMWGDCGNLYFYIKKADLQARRFDRVWLILQCG